MNIHSHSVSLRKLNGRLKRVTQSLMSPLGQLQRNAIFRHAMSMVNNKWFQRLYPLFALGLLIATTIFWALLGARVNLQNSDQLVNAYLFEKPATFKEALLPGSHSFLLKWPLFWLIKLLGYTNAAYIGVTIGVVLATVLLFAFILYCIERRPIVFGTILLALASVLMLIPTTAYAGALLPVNMAMLATRNIEYIIYIVSLILLTRSRRIRDSKFWCAVGVLAILAASDRLFLYLSLGGALLALTVYGLFSGWNLVRSSARWMLAALLGGLIASGLVWLINFSNITHIAATGGAGPYGIITSLRDLTLGLAYGILHILTNFGANPAATSMVLKDVPHDGLTNFLSHAGLAYGLNFVILAVTLLAAFEILRHSLAHNKDKAFVLDNSAKLSIALVWSSIVAFIIFFGTKHYYAADARYLGIVLFGLFIAGTTYVSRRQFSSVKLVIIGIVLGAATLLTIPNVLQSYHQNQAALVPLRTRNTRIAAVLKQHPVRVLVGDYWRVLPIHALTNSKTTVMPLASCTTPRDTLSSQVWQPNLSKTSFAYLLSLSGGSSTDYPHCSLGQVIAAYGRPNASIVIAGNITNPQELVLFYDKGAHKSAPVAPVKTSNALGPVDLDNLPYTSCKQPTTMNIVAHEDDDLLFMNPDLQADIKAGHCIRTIYVTAGDAGSNIFYWLGREQGSQAAYSTMLGFHDIWVQRTIHIAGNQYATLANPRGNQNISLIYLHLPDGNMHGQGFGIHNNETLNDLDTGRIDLIHEVYNGASYSKVQLIKALTSLMLTYQPTEIHTQSNFARGTTEDHSDHMAAGRLAAEAYQNYETEHFAGRVIIPIKYYIGYPIRNRPVNVFGTELQQKQDAFAAYIQFDRATCGMMTRCLHDPAYGAYLPRQYQNAY